MRNGIRGKVVKLIADPKGNHAGLPTYSNTSDMYFRINKSGEVVQGKVYIDRRQAIDFDWGHVHVNVGGDGKRFEKGIVHVQTYSIGKMASLTGTLTMQDT